jgi:hypothetical protein
MNVLHTHTHTYTHIHMHLCSYISALLSTPPKRTCVVIQVIFSKKEIGGLSLNAKINDPDIVLLKLATFRFIVVRNAGTSEHFLSSEISKLEACGYFISL